MTPAEAIARVLRGLGYTTQRDQAKVLGIRDSEWSKHLRHRDPPRGSKTTTIQRWLAAVDAASAPRGLRVRLELSATGCEAMATAPITGRRPVRATRPPVNARRVGAAFERRIASDLRTWLPDHDVVRNPTDFQAGKDGRAGEFSFSGPFEVPIVVECKAHRAFKLAHLFRSPLIGPVSAWWAQAALQASQAMARGECRQCAGRGKVRNPKPNSAEWLVRCVACHGSGVPSRVPLLVCKQSQQPPIVLMRRTTSLTLAPSREYVMTLAVHEYTVDMEHLHVWRWRDLMAVNSLRLREIG